MGIRTLLQFLFGGRQAMLQLASTRWTLVLGAIFVLTAALARDYDGEDLLHEPWHLLVPFAASLVASFVLFALVYAGKFRRATVDPPFFPAYFSFLGLFWMTAPLAWLYAIPFERFLGPVDSMKANLITLAVVAAWRVLLMIRVLMVLVNFKAVQAAVFVLGFGDALLLLGLRFLPVPIIEVMGGVRSPREQLLQAVALNAFCFNGPPNC